MLDERRSCLWLSRLRTLDPAGRQRLIRLFGSPEGVYAAKDTDLITLVSEELLKEETMEEIRTSRNDEENLALDQKTGEKCRVVTISDPDYPELLKEIADPPVALYYRGDIARIKDRICIGVVGSRMPDIYGNEVVHRFVPALCKAGVTIVSGLAMGIDATAHREAVDSGGRTAGVLGCGVDICYPRRNFYLYEKMCREELVLSEYPPGTAPLAIHFPARNRIISGLSRGLLVVEARKRSGTLITADAALDQGRNVYAVPGRIGDYLSEGTNNLIRQGAMLVIEPEDILKDLGIDPLKEKKTGGPEEKPVTEEERKLLSQLSLSPIYIDDLLGKTGFSVQKLLGMLYSLEERKLIRQPMQGYFVRG